MAAKTQARLQRLVNTGGVNLDGPAISVATLYSLLSYTEIGGSHISMSYFDL